MKDPALAGKIVIKNGGSIQTQAGTEIVSVSTAGVASVAADVQASAGSIGTTELAADAVTNAKLADTAVSLENLDSGIAPAYIVKYAGTFTTVGGDANETISVSGVVNTDIVLVSLKTKGATPRTILTAAAGTNQIDVVMSGDPSTDHAIYYTVLRAAS